MRAFSPGVFEEGFQRITALNGISVISSTDGFNCQISVRPVYQTSPWPRNEQTDRLLSLWKDTGFELGMHVSEEERGGLSDGNFIWKHFPTLDGLGPTGNNAHCSERSPNGNKDQEYVLATSFVPKALMNILAIQRLVESAEYG
jgi:glutamate carboxypeptidase